MITGRRYVVSGRVQGVGFRFYARDSAAREGINGWVRNLPDGSVEIEAHGDYEALIRFERAIRRGPAGARVEDVLVDPAPPSERHHGFRIEPWARELTCHMDMLKEKIRHVPDFPKAGILFYDITTLLREPAGFRAAVDSLAIPFASAGIDVVVGIESRGFILGGAVADRIGAGFSPVRKPGKLPSTTVRETYALEYGTDCLEIHDDAVSPGQRVLIVDDVIATGGTAKATAALVRRLGATVHGLAFLIELVALNGRNQLADENMYSVLKY